MLRSLHLSMAAKALLRLTAAVFLLFMLLSPSRLGLLICNRIVSPDYGASLEKLSPQYVSAPHSCVCVLHPFTPWNSRDAIMASDCCCISSSLYHAPSHSAYLYACTLWLVVKHIIRPECIKILNAVARKVLDWG